MNEVRVFFNILFRTKIDINMGFSMKKKEREQIS